MKNLAFFSKMLLVVITFVSCGKEGIDIEEKYYSDEDYALLTQYLDIDNKSFDYTFKYPDYYARNNVTFNNPMATLGRVLFYDTNLSEDESISCASCHKQELGFSDDLAFSDGVNNRQTARNSLALGSVFSFQEYYGSPISGRVPFFWDNRAVSVEEQAEMTFGNANEMDMNMDQVTAAVKEQPYYNVLFKQAYGSGGESTISKDKILESISVFINSMGSPNTKFDKELSTYADDRNLAFSQLIKENLGEVFTGFTDSENRGKNLFMDNCSSCHSPTNGRPGEIEANNGLEKTNEYEDIGTGNGKFKIPSLRNIALTAPYMHDGRFETLEDVLEFYSNGIQDHNHLHQTLKVGSSPKQFNFSEQDKEDFLSYFETLTDHDFITDEKYANPFK